MFKRRFPSQRGWDVENTCQYFIFLPMKNSGKGMRPIRCRVSKRCCGSMPELSCLTMLTNAFSIPLRVFPFGLTAHLSHVIFILLQKVISCAVLNPLERALTMALVEYTLDETVAVVTLNCGENRFNPTFVEAYLNLLNQIEKETPVSTLVVRSSHEKIFSNGLDLDWLLPVVQNQKIEEISGFFYLLNRLFKTILLYPMITVAAITGHAFAAGAIMCCAFDFRYMRSDRGYFCLPEIDLGMPFLPGMIALLKKAIPFYKLEELQYTGKRLTAEECAAHNIVTKACHMDSLMDETLAFAKSFNKRRGIIKEMKARMYADIVRVLETEDRHYIDGKKYSY